MAKRKDPVVASLSNRSPHPYSAIAMSPNRQYAIVAGKDTIQLVKIGPSGLKSLRSLKISQVCMQDFSNFVDRSMIDGKPTS
jgi:hypothetical protein